MRPPAHLLVIVALLAVAPSAMAQCAVVACVEPDASGSGVETWSLCPGVGVTACTWRGVGAGGWSGCAAGSDETRNTQVFVGGPVGPHSASAGLYERCSADRWDSWDVYVFYSDGHDDLHQMGIFWYAGFGVCGMDSYAYRHPVLQSGWGPESCPLGTPPPTLP